MNRIDEICKEVIARKIEANKPKPDPISEYYKHRFLPAVFDMIRSDTKIIGDDPFYGKRWLWERGKQPVLLYEIPYPDEEAE